ncbi:hypothetical protein VFPBJ_09939 [Purpureocillium lilacinum]|uniref:Uncharacterized protein n=1 Tax=Purpureocillium lilacinum TaxID=33203 RepID=A0A179GA13_PURLI|nr:hypothetical protein VFPBJ_09939 [Purpureocillium lilacinum]
MSIRTGGRNESARCGQTERERGRPRAREARVRVHPNSLYFFPLVLPPPSLQRSHVLKPPSKTLPPILVPVRIKRGNIWVCFWNCRRALHTAILPNALCRAEESSAADSW